MTFLSGPLPRIIAHRGLALEAPENTLLAFLRALSAGATHLETDVHASADGVAVISHDPDLSRLVGRDVRVDQLT
ncbi:glycerophosphodiester phosphodiesterase, partial [Kitasatospora herbaricolor]|uniref:glycerophosphodiester phosphodiesterase n=1 Tax=Kitasatospora herbaricolor TaxID=68217 RepID=UPI0036DC62C0